MHGRSSQCLEFRVLVQGGAHLAQAILKMATLAMRECRAEVAGVVVGRHGGASGRRVAKTSLLLVVRLRHRRPVRCTLVRLQHGVDPFHAFVQNNAVFACCNVIFERNNLTVHGGNRWVGV